MKLKDILQDLTVIRQNNKLYYIDDFTKITITGHGNQSNVLLEIKDTDLSESYEVGLTLNELIEKYDLILVKLNDFIYDHLKNM